MTLEEREEALLENIRLRLELEATMAVGKLMIPPDAPACDNMEDAKREARKEIDQYFEDNGMVSREVAFQELEDLLVRKKSLH